MSCWLPGEPCLARTRCRTGPEAGYRRATGSNGAPRVRRLKILHLSPLIILVAAARTWRRQILQAAALAITTWSVPILAVLRVDAPVVAAFDPIGALLAFWLAIVVARGATRLVGSTDVAA